MMTRTATPSFDNFDPDVLDAARDVARRAGVPLETWIASVMPEKARPGSAKSAAKQASKAPRRGASDLGKPPMAGSRASTRVEAPIASPRVAELTEPHPDDALNATVQALLARIDGLDRTLAEERLSVEEAARRRIADIESRIGAAIGASAAPVQQVAERLGDSERQMSALGEQLAASRPPGRRGRPAAAEIHDAVQDIRQRQRELGEGAAPSIVATMREDIARRLDATVEETAPAETAVSELRRETSRLRESIGHLATRRDLGALEQAVISLASGIERAEAPADLAAIAAPIELIRAQVERLADDVSENVHSRVAGEVERLALRLDAAVAAGRGSAVEHDALKTLFGELEEMRRLIGALAGPERIQSLAAGVQAISAQIAQLQKSAAAGGDTTLRPLLEEIRSGLTAGVPAPSALVGQIEAIASKLDAMQAGARGADAANSKAILRRIDALADKVDRVSAQPVGDLIGRLEGLGESLGESLRKPPIPGGDVDSIHAMLRNLAEKVDRVGTRAGDDGLDALEKQVVSLADRLDARSGDPTLASLERTMGDLLKQVSALRDEAPIEAAVARAARSAVADSLGDARGSGDRSEFGLLRAGLADMQARQAASDQRLATTLEGVQTALERLTGRLDAPAAPGRAPVGSRAAPLDERLLASTGVEAPRARTARRPELPSAVGTGLNALRASDEPLEPGAGRPAKDASPRERYIRDRVEAADADASADIKSNFIAAARRAAQAAQAEVASEADLSAGRREPRTSPHRPTPAADTASDGPVARLRAEINRRRRPLLLGLAAIVLALGALQAISMRSTSDGETARAAPPPTVVAGTAAPKTEPSPEPRAEKVEPSAPADARPAPVDPQTTQALPSPSPAEARVAQARNAVPQVSNMATLAGDLAGVPAGLSKLRQSALDGDGTAIWDLAGREADGRGLPRDLALAAKLYEKLATAGYAPAQYKLGGQYEKGAGLVRDLEKAKLWYGRAAEQGHARSMHNLAVIYAENPGPNGKPDYASAASWFRQGAEYGVRDSQYNLAVLYARGLGLTQDLTQSYAWFAAAAAQGDEDAGKKRDDVAAKLSPSDLAAARSIAANFKPHRLDRAVNEPPVSKDATGPMTLLGAPAPINPAFAPPGRKGV